MPPSDELRHIYRHGTFVIWPPDDVRAAVTALRRRYDPASDAICEAHITLTQPFLDEPDDEAWNAIQEVASQHPPFAIEYGPLDHFLPYPCVYLEIRPAEPLLALRTALHDLGHFNLGLPFSRPDEFVPHMSITDGYPDEQQTRLILAALSGSEPAGSFTCRKINYIRPDETFRFYVERRISLGA